MRALVLIAMVLAGCSWIGVTPKTKPIPGAHARYCTDSYFLPTVDAVFAAGWLAPTTGAVIATATQNDTAQPDLFPTPLLLGASAIALTYTAAAIMGYRDVYACNAGPS